MPVVLPTEVGSLLMLRKVISGGQTGVDRAALDAAMEAGLQVGGRCPWGFRAEDGKIPAKYGWLIETHSWDYRTRTVANVRDADATLIVARGRLSSGTFFTLREAERQKKPHVLVRLDVELDVVTRSELLRWLCQDWLEVLNVAGPRESKRPGIYDEAKVLLTFLFQDTLQVDSQVGH